MVSQSGWSWSGGFLGRRPGEPGEPFKSVKKLHLWRRVGWICEITHNAPECAVPSQSPVLKGPIMGEVETGHPLMLGWGPA